MVSYNKAIPPDVLVIETAKYALAGTILHSAACVYNDLCDIDIDSRVGELINDPKFSSI